MPEDTEMLHMADDVIDLMIDSSSWTLSVSILHCTFQWPWRLPWLTSPSIQRIPNSPIPKHVSFSRSLSRSWKHTKSTGKHFLRSSTGTSTNSRTPFMTSQAGFLSVARCGPGLVRFYSILRSLRDGLRGSVGDGLPRYLNIRIGIISSESHSMFNWFRSLT